MHMLVLYLKMAQEGNLMFEIKDFKKELFSSVSGELKFITKQEMNNLFKQLEQQGLIHTTTRHFGDTKPIKYISLYLKCISLESLIWL